MRELADHAVAWSALTTAAVAPVIRLDRAAQHDGALAGQVLADDGQANIIALAERGQIRGGVATLRHVEVFGEAV